MDPSKTSIFSQDSAFLQQYQSGFSRSNEAVRNASPQKVLLGGNTQAASRILTQNAMKSSVKQEPMWFGEPGSQLPGQVLKLPPGSIINPRQGFAVASGRTSLVNPYIRKWRRLKRVIKDMVFVNASICDEVVRVEEKLARVKEERRFLLRKLLHYQSYMDGNVTSSKTASTTSLKTVGTPGAEPLDTQATKSKAKAKKKVASMTVDKKKMVTIPTVAKEILEAMQPKGKKSKGQVQRKIIPPLQLDSTGRPIFPLVIGDLTIHSIGEIVSDRSGFHSSQHIYPEGFCSTRSYVSTLDPSKSCLYTCTISDGGKGPVFEIDAEDNPDFTIQGSLLNECHNALISAINKACGTTVVETSGDGATFFGLSHPVVQNLIQSCPGSRRCSGYKWIKFEISKSETAESVSGDAENDPTINFESFKTFVSKGGIKSQSQGGASLRSLLTSKDMAVKRK